MCRVFDRERERERERDREKDTKKLSSRTFFLKRDAASGKSKIGSERPSCLDLFEPLRERWDLPLFSYSTIGIYYLALIK